MNVRHSISPFIHTSDELVRMPEKQLATVSHVNVRFLTTTNIKKRGINIMISLITGLFSLAASFVVSIFSGLMVDAIIDSFKA